MLHIVGLSLRVTVCAPQMMDDETFRAWILEMYSAIWSAQREVLPARFLHLLEAHFVGA